MTEEEEYELLNEIGNSFWEALGKLAAEHIAKLPSEIEGNVTAYLQDRCSIYRTRYDEYLAAERAKARSI